MSPQLTQRKCS